MFQDANKLKFERSKNCNDFPNGEFRLSDLDIEQLGRHKLAVSGTLGITKPLSKHIKVRIQTNLTAVSINFKTFTANFARMLVSWALTLCMIINLFRRFGRTRCLHLQMPEVTGGKCVQYIYIYIYTHNYIDTIRFTHLNHFRAVLN
jgi:Flp pilus assembly protein TadB